MVEACKKNQLVLVQLVCNKSKSYGKEEIYYIYNYILEYLNIIQINSKVKNTIGIKVAKGYRPSDINKNILEIKWVANKTTLRDTRGIYLDLKEIHNTRALWKFNNLDRHIAEVKI